MKELDCLDALLLESTRLQARAKAQKAKATTPSRPVLREKTIEQLDSEWRARQTCEPVDITVIFHSQQCLNCGYVAQNFGGIFLHKVKKKGAEAHEWQALKEGELSQPSYAALPKRVDFKDAPPSPFCIHCLDTKTWEGAMAIPLQFPFPKALTSC